VSVSVGSAATEKIFVPDAEHPVMASVTVTLYVGLPEGVTVVNDVVLPVLHRKFPAFVSAVRVNALP
jgi:hypothetical protein